MFIITSIEYYRDDRYLDMLKYTWWSGNTVESARTFWNKTTRDACNEIWRLMYQIVLDYAAGKLTCRSPETFYDELIYPQIKDMYEFYWMENWFKERYGNNPSQMFFSIETPIIETPTIIETPPIRKSYLEKYFHYPRHKVRTYRDGVDVTDEVEDEVMANDDDTNYALRIGDKVYRSWWGAGPVSNEYIDHGVMIKNLTKVEADRFLYGTWNKYSGYYGFWVDDFVWEVLIENGFLIDVGATSSTYEEG